MKSTCHFCRAFNRPHATSTLVVFWGFTGLTITRHEERLTSAEERTERTCITDA